MKTRLPHRFPLVHLSAAALLSLSAASLHAQAVYWGIDNGAWEDGANWEGGNPPGSSNPAYFAITANSPAAKSTVSISSSPTTGNIAVGFGKTVELNLAANQTFTTSAWYVGIVAPTGAAVAPAHAILNGEAGSKLSFTAFTVGNVSTQKGSSLTINGPIEATGGASSFITVGRYGEEATLKISGGAKIATNNYVQLGNVTDRANGTGNHNRLEISGEGSMLTINNPGINGLVIGSSSITGLSASVRQINNGVIISDGGRMVIDASAATSTSAIRIGNAHYRQSNFLQISGAGSRLDLLGNGKIDLGFNGTQTWDNRIELTDGGTLFNDGELAISGNRGSNERNRLVINGGHYLSDASINVAGGQILLSNGGSIKAQKSDESPAALNISVSNSANVESLFEAAAGTTIGAGVSVTMAAGTTFAVTGDPAADQTVLELPGSLTFEDAAIFQTTIFGAGANDLFQINVTEDGGITFEDGAILALSLGTYTAVGGESWQLFTGGNAIVGDLDLSLLPALSGGLSWDTADFNAAGGWRIGIASIPEPGTVALTVAGIALLLGGGRRWKTARP